MLVSNLPLFCDFFSTGKSRSFDIVPVRSCTLAVNSPFSNLPYINQLAFSVSHILQTRRPGLLSTVEEWVEGGLWGGIRHASMAPTVARRTGWVCGNVT